MSFASNYLKLRAEREVNSENQAGDTKSPASSKKKSFRSSSDSFTSGYLALREKRESMSVSERAEERVRLLKQQQGLNSAPSSYYSPPKFGSAREKLYSNITALEPVLTEKRTALDAARTSLVQSEADLQTVRKYLDQALVAYHSDPSEANANSYNQIAGAYNVAHDSYSSAFKAYSAAYDDYKPYEEEAITALTLYRLYDDNQNEAFNNWRGTIRDADTIQNDIAAIDQKIVQQTAIEKAAAEIAQKENLALYEARQREKPWYEKMLGYLGETQDTSLPMAGITPGTVNSAYDDRWQEPSQEMQSLLDAKKLLEEELDWSRYYYYADYAAADDFGEMSKYVPQERKQRRALDLMMDNYSDDASGWEDPLYEYINGNEAAGAYLSNAGANYYGSDNALGSIFGRVADSKSESQQMKEPEIAIFNYLYATQGKAAAYAYYDYLQRDLNYRQREADEEKWKTYATEHPAASSVFSVAVSPLKGMSYIGQLADLATTGTIDENAAYNRFSYIPGAIRGQVVEQMEAKGNWDKVGSFAYQTGLSMADFLLTSALTGGNQAAALTIMGSGAAADTVIAAKDRGLNDGQAFTLGTIAGIAEAAMESMNMETVFKPDLLKEGILKYILKNGAAEGMEEVGTDVVNLVADVLISKDQSEWQASIDYYMRQDMTEAEAIAKALGDQALTMALDAGGGFLSGSILSGSTAVINAKNTKKIGKELDKLDLDESDIQAFIETGLESDPDSASYYLAKKMQAKIEAGEQLSNNDLARLYQANAQAIQAEEETTEDLPDDIVIGDDQTATVAEDVAEPSGLQLPSLEADTQNGQLDTTNLQNVTSTQANDTVLPAGVPLSVADQLRLEQAQNGGAQYESAQRTTTGPAVAQPAGGLHLPGRTGVSDGGTQWNVGASTAEQTGILAGSPEQRRSAWADRSRATVARQNYARSLRLEKVSSLDLGLKNGTEVRNIQIVPQEYWDSEMVQLDNRIYNETGKHITYVMGRIQIRGTNGSVTYARGVITGERIVVQADHLRLPMEQIADHEAYHAKVDFSNGRLNDEIRRHIIETFSAEQFRQVLDKYIVGLRGVIDINEARTQEEYEATVRQIEEEIFADAYAGINAFSAGADQFTDAVNEKMDQLYMGKLRDQANGTEQPTGPPFTLTEAQQQAEHNLRQTLGGIQIEQAAGKDSLQVTRNATENSEKGVTSPEPIANTSNGDELLTAAVEVILETGKASIPTLQRHLGLGYARAARIMDEMEDKGFVGPFTGSAPRQILITKEQWSAQQNGTNQPASPPTNGRYSLDADTAVGYEGRSLTDDPKVYSYDFLTSQPPMNPVELPTVSSVRDAGGKIEPVKIAENGLKNALSVGTERDGKVYVKNRYTNRELRVTASAIRHGLNGPANRILTNARLGSVIGEIVQNAIPINALHNTADGVEGTYAMAGYAFDRQGREFVAVVTVEQRTDTVAEIDVYDITHAVSGRQKRGKQVDTESQGVNPSMLASKINIADFLQSVNSTYRSILSENVLNKIGESKSADGYYTGRVRYSYADESANNADLDALERAEEMQGAGVADETIRQQTGWHKDTDGKWNWKHSDSHEGHKALAEEDSDDLSLQLGDRYSADDTQTYAEIQERQQELRQRELDLQERKRVATNNPELLQAMDDYSGLFTEMHGLLPKRKNGTATQAELDRIKEIKTLRDECMQRIADLQESLGLAAISQEETDIREEKETLRVAADAAWAREGAERENLAIAKAGVSPSEYFRRKALKAFKTTSNFNEAGYLLPDGKMLNFSGGERNHRNRDHREIGEIYEATNGVAAMNRFLADGNIRIIAESPGADLSAGVEPTREQYAALRKFINSNGVQDGRFYIDFSNADGSGAGNYAYEGRIYAERVLNDIKHYYATGETVQRMDLNQFRYSVDDEGSQQSQEQKPAAAPKKNIRPVAESLPLIAKKDLRNTVFSLFSIPGGVRSEMGSMIDSYADRLIKNGTLTEADRKAFFDRMYDAGVMTMPANDYYAEARNYLKGGRIYISDSVVADFGDDWNDIRRRAFAAGIYLTRSQTSGGYSVAGIDTWNSELASDLPGLFDAEETDQRSILERIVQVAEEGKDENLSLAEYTARLAQVEHQSEDEFLDNMERQLDWALRTFAEKARLEVHLRDRTGRKIAQEREKGVERMTRQKAQEAQRRAEERQSRKDSARRAKERRELRELQQRTLKQLQWLNKNRNRAPEELKAAWDEILGDIDLYAVSAADEMHWSDKHNATWRDLAQMYKDAMKNDPNFLPSKELERIVTRLDATKIGDMDLGALQDLYKAAIGLRTEFYNRNNVINDEMQRLFAEVYTDTKKEIESAPGGFTGNVLDKFVNLDQLTPMNVLQRMAGWDPDSAFYSMAKQLERGERDIRAYSVKAQKMLQEFLTEHEDWVKKADGQGKDAIWYEVEVPQLLELGMGDKPIFGPTVKVYMTPAQKVHMYLESKNVDNLRHMTGGRTFADKELYSKGKRQEALSQGRTIKLAPETVRKLVSDLTPEEMELARLLDRYYNTFATKEINKVSNVLYGYDKAMGKNYAPIYTNRNYTKTEFGVFDTTAEGVGNLKGRQYAVNPSYNISAFDAFERHVDQTARFCGMAIPARNWTTLMNWREKNNSTGDVITHKWGEQSKQYISDLITTLQSGDDAKTDTVSSTLSKLQSNYISAIFGANPSIVLKQLGSIPLAGAYLDTRNMPTPAQISSIDRSLISKYTQELEWRTMGYTTPETKQLKDNPNWTQSNKVFKFAFGGGAITAMDGWAASVLWPWAENKVRREYPELAMGTKEEIENGESTFYKKVAEEFENAMSRSQSVSDEIHQGSLRKSKNPITRAFTLFRSDSAQTYNALRQKIGEARYYMKSGAKDKVIQSAKKAAGTAFVAMLINAAWSEGINFLMALWKNKGKKYRDDEDELTAQSVAGEMVSGMLGSFAGVVAGGEELFELIGNIITGEKWYGIETPGMEQLNDLVDVLMESGSGMRDIVTGGWDILKNGGNLADYFSKHSGDILGSIKDLAAAAATYLPGMPVNNLEAYLVGAMKWISPELGAAYDDLFSDVGKNDLAETEGSALESRIGRILGDRRISDSDETVQALAALYTAGHKTAVPGDTPTSISIDGESHRLGAYQQQAYDTIWGGIVADALDNLVASDSFQGADHEIQAKMLSNLYTYAAEQAKAELFDEYELDSGAAKNAAIVAAGATVAECITWNTITSEMKSGEKSAELASWDIPEEAKREIFRCKISDSKEDSIAAFDEAGLSFDQFLQAYSMYGQINNEDLKAGMKAVEFSHWVNAQGYTAEQAAVVKDELTYFNMTPASSSRYDELVGAGMDPDEAYDLTGALNELQPADGEDEVSDLQKWRASVDFSDDVEDQLAALSAVMTDAQFLKVEIANNFGVSPDAYVTLQEIKPQYDADGNGSYKNEEIQAAVDGLPGYYTTEQKAVLWQLATGSSSSRNNPYSRQVGQQVLDARAAAKEAAAQEQTEAPTDSTDDDSFSQALLDQLLGRG